MSLSGNLKSISLSDVLQLLSTTRKTCELHVTRGSDNISIYFRDGKAFCATSTNPAFRTGNILLRRKLLTEAQLLEGMRVQKESKGKLTKTFMDIGFLTEEQLIDVLQFQAREIIYEMFTWEDGDFHVQDNKQIDIGIDYQPMDITELILEGLRQVDERNRMLANKPSNGTIYTVNTAVVERQDKIVLNPPEFEALSLIDGKRSVSVILAESARGEFDTIEAIQNMLARGLIKPV